VPCDASPLATAREFGTPMNQNGQASATAGSSPPLALSPPALHVVPGCAGLQHQRKRPAELPVWMDDDLGLRQLAPAAPGGAHSAAWTSDGVEEEAGGAEAAAVFPEDDADMHDEDKENQSLTAPPPARHVDHGRALQALPLAMFERFGIGGGRVAMSRELQEASDVGSADAAAAASAESTDADGTAMEDASEEGDESDDSEFFSENLAERLEQRIRDNADGMYDFEIWVDEENR